MFRRMLFDHRAVAWLFKGPSAARVWLISALFFGCGGSSQEGDQFAQMPGTGSWSPVPIAEDSRVGNIWFVSAWTGDELLVWGGFGCLPPYSCDGGARYDVASGGWSEMSSDGAPTSRWHATSVWTEGEFIVWGGVSSESGQLEAVPKNDGAAYTPQTDTWRPLSLDGAPEPRAYHVAVWTGSSMIVWGGSLHSSFLEGLINTGGEYFPESDTWLATNMDEAPEPRSRFSAVWTGEEMLVWGGHASSDGNLNTGGAYNPTTRSWRQLSKLGAPAARVLHTAIWTGREMMIVGGVGCGACNAAAYDPESDTWRDINSGGPSFSDSVVSAAWSGTELFVWNGVKEKADGIYNPELGTWRRITEQDAPARRDHAVAHWTGEQFLIWGGLGADHLGESLWDGGLFTPQ